MSAFDPAVLTILAELTQRTRDLQDDMKALRAELARRDAQPSLPAPAILPRLTVRQFAAVVEMHPEVIRLKIRVGQIPRELVFGRSPLFISPKALASFGVTPPEAQARLAALASAGARSPSPASQWCAA